MLYDGIQLVEGASISNAAVESGTAFPGTASTGELFFRSDLQQMYVYNGTAWSAIAGVADAGDLSGTTLASNVVNSSLTSVGTVTSGTWSASFGAVSGANLTNLTAANLTGTTLPSNIVNSSLTSVGTLASLAVTGNVTAADPTATTHLTTKSYVDALVQGLTWKTAVRAATTANITLSGTQTVDGVALAVGNRVLVKNQTTTTQNGVYIVASGAWTRSADMDGSPDAGEVNGAAMYVTDGTTNADTTWTQTATVTTVGSQAMQFAQLGAGAVNASNLLGTTLASNVVSSSLTSVGTLTSLTVAGTTNLQSPVNVGSAAGGTFQVSVPIVGSQSTLAINAGRTDGDFAGTNITITAGSGWFYNNQSGGSVTISSNSGGSGINAYPGDVNIYTPASPYAQNGMFKVTTGNVERLRIASNGAWGLAGANYGTSGQVLTSTGSSTAPTWQNAPAASPGGADTQIQFNNAGAFGGDADLVWNLTSNTLTVGSVATPATFTSPVNANASAGADITIRGGAANLGTYSCIGGSVTIQGGHSIAAGGAQAGDAIVAGGNQTAGANAYGGNVQLRGGAAGGTLGGYIVALTGNPNVERFRILRNGTWSVGANGTDVGTAGQVLTSNGSASPPTWSSITSLGTVTTGTWNATAIGAIYGGTGLTSYTTGDLIYASATNTLSKRAVGTEGQVLTVQSGAPVWATPSASGGSTLPRVTSITSAANGKRVVVSTSQTVPATTWPGGGAIAEGDIFSVYNASGSPITLVAGAGLTMYKDGTATAVGSVTLYARGTCSVWYNTASEVVVSGSVA